MIYRIFLAVILAGVGATWSLGKEKPDPAIPSPDAQMLIDKVRAAYAKVQSLDLVGRLTADLDIAGQVQKREIGFSAQYKAPARYRHEVKGEVVAGSTGEKIYLHELERNVYTSADAPTTRSSYRQLPPVVGQLLEVQDPALLLAISSNSVADLVDGGKNIHLGEQPQADGQAWPMLEFTAGDGRQIQLAFDPHTSLLRQATYDLAGVMRNRGAEQVKKALITISYSEVKPNAPLADAQFAWTPPANAREVAGVMDDDSAGSNLQGSPAPDFTLSGLDGKPVSLAQLKGSVVLLDFWATWCPPCVRALPEINEIHHAKKGTVKVFAVNVGEDKDTIQKFLTDKKLDLPVLMDSEEAVSKKYGIRGIPTTIIIKADGTVHKVFVGMPAGGKAEVERELGIAASK